MKIEVSVLADDPALAGRMAVLEDESFPAYLNEEPILPNVDTYDLSDPDQREHVIHHIESMVVKPADVNFYGTGVDRVQVYVPRAANAKLFGRLLVTVP